MRFSWLKCSALTSIAVLSLAGCESPQDEVTNPGADDATVSAVDSTVNAHFEGLAASRLGQPFARLTAEEQERFAEGQEEFEEVETADDGLGPVFNEAGCAVCHTNPVGGTNNRLETRFGKLVAGVFDPMASAGGSLIQDQGIGAVGGDPPTHTFVAEVVPGDANVRASRITTPLFGLGLVDAVPDEAFLRLASLQARKTPATAGTANMVFDIASGSMRVGKFGWKAQVPTLHQFSGDAYLNEMGITSPEFPDENCPQGDCAQLAFNPMPELNDSGEAIGAFADFMTLLAPPDRGRRTLEVLRGGLIFAAVGCADCHTPVLVTGASPVAALSKKGFSPFSDFLLHDMGSLGDGIVQGNATGRHMRTAPLWGIRNRTALLHDGRATTVTAAIRAHDGQGRFARSRFSRLSSRSRATLLAFVNSL